MANETQKILSNSVAAPDEYLPFLATKEIASVASMVSACSFELAVALAAKGFVILTGQSGTGKSRSAIELGQALNALEEYDNGERGLSYEFMPVEADWVDARPLLGYMNPFGKPRKRSDGTITNETYEIPNALKLLLRAAAPANAGFPMILILDEMNLSHVERYFSPFLSLLEANRSTASESDINLLPVDKILLISEILTAEAPNSPVAKAAEELIAEGGGLPISDNLLIIGTVNVDETTYMFSPKVLDRAHVIELRSVLPENVFRRTLEERRILPARLTLELLQWAIRHRAEGAFDQHPTDLMAYAVSDLEVDQPAADEIRTATEILLNGAYRLLDPIGFGFGFRVINEVFAYLICG